MKRSWFFALILSLTCITMSTTLFAQSCTTGTLGALNGTYTFSGNGTRNIQTLVDVGYVVFDGNGQVTAAEFFEDLNAMDSTFSYSGTYAINADCSYTVTLNDTSAPSPVLPPRVPRTFNVAASGIDLTTGIAQKAIAIANAAGDTLALSLDLKVFPGQITLPAGTYSGSYKGSTNNVQNLDGWLTISIDGTGKITSGTFSSASSTGSVSTTTITGQITLTPDSINSGLITGIIGSTDGKFSPSLLRGTEELVVTNSGRLAYEFKWQSGTSRVTLQGNS